jgi:hypothetical protein
MVKAHYHGTFWVKQNVLFWGTFCVILDLLWTKYLAHNSFQVSDFSKNIYVLTRLRLFE